MTALRGKETPREKKPLADDRQELPRQDTSPEKIPDEKLPSIKLAKVAGDVGAVAEAEQRLRLQAADKLSKDLQTQWRRGDPLEVYSKSAGCWCAGTVVDVQHPDNLLTGLVSVRYTANGKEMTKNVLPATLRPVGASVQSVAETKLYRSWEQPAAGGTAAAAVDGAAFPLKRKAETSPQAATRYGPIAPPWPARAYPPAHLHT